MTPERWQQIETLYHAARGRPADERVAFLAGACSDAELRSEVERLLSQPGSGEGLLAGGAMAMAAALSAERRAGLTGRTLGGYHVQGLIGVGGMGEVYRARDGKLGRDVAIKVLPPAFTSDPIRLARFEREARTLAALNHPNICAIYGFDVADDVRFLILELVDGHTLADRLAVAGRRPDAQGLPQREALNIARQIARALDFAHERGIVHRDLKPANVKITADGTVKVLDFGLAKAVAGDAGRAELETAPDLTSDRTMEGTIVGTPAYMSPEQARGQPIDKRTDIWAFGCVLYETLTGRPAFAGGTIADTIARILEREPDLAALPEATPEPVRTLLLGCLAKDSRERLRDIGDVGITIDGMLSGSGGASILPRAPAPKAFRAAWLPWAIVAALVIVVAGMGLWSARPQPPSPVMRWTVELAPSQTLDGSGGAHVVSLSHDGTLMAYVALPLRLFLQQVGEIEAKPVPGTEAYKGVREPVFSPDGKEIAFYAFADQTLKRMAVSGGEAQTICPADTPMGMSWGTGGIVFGQGRKGIMRVSPNGGPVETIVLVEDGQEAHGPQVLPDGDHVLFTLATGEARDRWDKARIVIQSISTPADRQTLPITGSDARYVPNGTGYLVYAVGARVNAIQFDAGTRQVTGDSVVIEEGVSRAAGAFTGAANFSVSDTGRFIYVPGPTVQAPMDLALLDPTTKTTTRLNLPSDPYDVPRMSPDETRVAYGNGRDKQWTVYTYDMSSRSAKQLTSGSNNRYPAWTHNGKRLAFQSNRDGDAGIWWQPADGSVDAERLTRAADRESHIPESWSADTLLYGVTKNDEVSLRTLSFRNGQPVSQPFGRMTSSDPMEGVFSPDGRLVAYTLTKRGTTTVCVDPFPATTPGVCLPPHAADSPKHPRWAPIGRRLYYDPRLGDFESVTVSTEPVLHFGAPEAVNYHPFLMGPPGTRASYDVTASGKFLGMVTPGRDGYERPISNKILVVLNWFEVLRQKMQK